jgi:hypothetical protein
MDSFPLLTHYRPKVRSRTRSAEAHDVNVCRVCTLEDSKPSHKHARPRRPRVSPTQITNTTRLIPFKGNSDPFQSVSIEVTPQISEILMFGRTALTPAYCCPFIIQHMARQIGFGLYQPYLFKARAEVSRGLQDQGIAFAIVTSMAQAMGTCISDDKKTLALVSHLRQHSLTSLRDKVDSFMTSPDNQKAQLLRQQLFSVLRTERVGGDKSAVVIHRSAIENLPYVEQPFTVAYAIRTMRFIDQTAASTGQRSLLSSFGKLKSQIKAHFLENFRTHPLGVPEAHKLNSNIILPELRDVFNCCWYFVDASSNDKQMSKSRTSDEVQSLYNFIILQSLSLMTSLNDMYHDLIGGLLLPEASNGERNVQAALCMALNCLARELFGDITVGKTNIADYSLILLAQLSKTYRGAYTSSTLKDRYQYNDAFLWVLYVGSLLEQKKYGDLEFSVENNSKTWFRNLLAVSAPQMKVTNWSQMQAIANQFFYTDLVHPDGKSWFEDLLERKIETELAKKGESDGWMSQLHKSP